MRMHVLVLLVFFAVLPVASLSETTYAQHRVDYDVAILDDGTAMWRIVEVDSSQNVAPNPFEDLNDRLASLLASAIAETGRAMSFSIEKISVNFSGSYATVEYLLTWVNFCSIENSTITVGDVFSAANWSMQLYGDGSVIVSYPSHWQIEAISPTPYRHDSSHCTIIWLGTLDFKEGEPRVVMKEKNPSLGILEALSQNSVLIAAVALAFVGLSSGLYVVRRNQKNIMREKAQPELGTIPGLENGEDTILRLLTASAGQTAPQSAIAERCNFSKAKTSQILAALEREGKVKRYKKGRDKIVVLASQRERRNDSQCRT